MKSIAFLATIAALTACADNPTAPSLQSDPQMNLSVAQTTTLRTARNPAGTGQPSQSCGSANALVQPNGFSTGGFTAAALVYAGSDNTPSLANGSPTAVSQYDVACYQLSNK